MKEYIIVGDYNGPLPRGASKECLIYICGSLENAKMVLDRMLNDPTPNDILVAKGHTNLKIQEVGGDAWWHHGTN